MQEPLPIVIESAIDSTPDHRAPRAHQDRRGRAVSDWRIDALTRRTGLKGVARARAVLEAIRPAGRHTDQPDAA
jgi:hypothetical protein